MRDINAKCPTTGVRLQPTVQLHFPITAAQNDLFVTYQSIKENPKSARDTNVSINKRES